LRSICGTLDDAFNTRLVQEAVEACVSRSDPDPHRAAVAVIAALRDIAPATAREAMIAAQIVVTHHAALDCHRRAQAASGPLQAVQLEQASRLSRTHAMLSDALERLRVRDERRVVVIEHRHLKSA
jgi:hypothetical protein